MRRIYGILIIAGTVLLWSACSKGSDGINGPEPQQLELNGLAPVLSGQNAGNNDFSRATSDFVVNKAADPTFDVTRLAGTSPGSGPSWNLNVQLFDKSGNIYTPANATWSYDGGKGYWVPAPISPATAVYYPSYITPQVKATLYPDTPNAPLALNQSVQADFFKQDILVQNGTTFRVTPAHVGSIQLEHSRSMLDFILTDINPNDIAVDGIKVVVGTGASAVTYTPYRVGTTNEYLLILPVGTAYPQIKVTTKDGARYSTTVNISSTVINNCYCIKLTGVELLLSSVTVIDWTYGTALSGQYTTPTSYPTFRGERDETITLYFDNGLSQIIEFNDRGEATEKPAGRRIIKIDNNTLTTPIILDKMYVDLRPYLS